MPMKNHAQKQTKAAKPPPFVIFVPFYSRFSNPQSAIRKGPAYAAISRISDVILPVLQDSPIVDGLLI
jgi:hypothetical protein